MHEADNHPNGIAYTQPIQYNSTVYYTYLNGLLGAKGLTFPGTIQGFDAKQDFSHLQFQLQRAARHRHGNRRRRRLRRRAVATRRPASISTPRRSALIISPPAAMRPTRTRCSRSSCALTSGMATSTIIPTPITPVTTAADQGEPPFHKNLMYGAVDLVEDDGLRRRQRHYAFQQHQPEDLELRRGRHDHTHILRIFWNYTPQGQQPGQLR